MSGGENTLFLEDPVGYVRAKAVDITRFPLAVSGHLDVRAAFSAEQAIDSWWRGMGPDYINAWNVISFDLIKRHKDTVEGGKTSYIFRLDRRTFTEEQKAKMTEDRWEKFDNAKHAITGHFFPYASPARGTADVNEGTWGVANMGFVDFLRVNPTHPFVFTGAMNGCAIVITESPLGDDYYRAYHYPNVSTYPKFIDRSHWPHTPLFYWTFADYGGDGEMEADALNFLFYAEGEWHLCCQPHAWIKTTELRAGTLTEFASSVPVTSIRTKLAAVRLPGAIRLSDLRRTFE